MRGDRSARSRKGCAVGGIVRLTEKEKSRLAALFSPRRVLMQTGQVDDY
jgi:hypothetical protein